MVATAAERPCRAVETSPAGGHEAREMRATSLYGIPSPDAASPAAGLVERIVRSDLL